MDYNNHEHEGHNLPIAGEDSSKISSVLRPFALPKFDFDDSLHGHLRFDSLVENEVFLGISSQEDNQWIEEFSRGGSGIEFCSSVTESCTLPRHINVWSEATSSESVEMLLKAVGQEEMVPGENMIEDSDTFDQLDSSTRQIENNSRPNAEVNDVDLGNPSVLPTEVEENFTRSNQIAIVEGVLNAECALQNQDTRITCRVTADENMITEISNNDTKRAGDKQGETLASVDEFLPNQVHGNIPLDGEIDNIGKSSLTGAVSVGQSQVKIGDISFACSSCEAKAISESLEKNEDCNKDEERFDGIVVEDDNTKMDSNKISSKVETSREEQEVEIHGANFGKTFDVLVKQKSVSTNDGCHEVTFVEEPVRSQHGTVVFTSGTEVQHPSESHSTFLEKSPISSEGEDPADCGVHCSDIVTPVIDGNTELKSVPMILLSDQQKSPVANEDTCRGSDSSFMTIQTTFESSMFHKVLGKPSEEDCENNSNPADGPDNLKSSAVPGLCCEDKSVTDDMGDAADTVMVQKVDRKDDDHDNPSLVVESVQTCTTYTTSIHVVDVKNTSISQLNSSTGDYLQLNTEVEDTKFTSLCTECSELAEGHVHSDHIVEAGLNFTDQRCTSAMKDSLELNFDPVVTEMKTSDQPMPSVETSVDVSDELGIKVSKTNGHTTINLILNDTTTEKSMEEEKDVEDVTKISTLSDSHWNVEFNDSNQEAEPCTIGGDCTQSHANPQASLGSNRKDSDDVPMTSENSGLNVPSEKDRAFTFDIIPLGGQSMGNTSKFAEQFPQIHPCKLSLTGEGSPSICGAITSDATIVKETSYSSTSAAAVCPSSGSTRDHKARRGSVKPGKKSAKKGNQVKNAAPLKLTEEGGKSWQFSSPLGTNQLMKYESTLKPRGAVSIATCSLPDLNTSAPPSAFFKQPFTDLQQLQLRAQIFVYGSLIQGAVPDEACMVSAFGLPDGDRNVWESSWHACVERLRSHKSQGNSSETPFSARPVSKASDQSNKQVFNPVDTSASFSGRASNKALPSPVHPMIPLSSPLWSIATLSSDALSSGSMVRSSIFDYQTVSPLNPYQTPIQNYLSHSSGQPQAPFSVPWLASSQSSLFDGITKSSPFDISASYLAFPTVESWKTPVKELSLPNTSGKKHSSPMSTAVTGASTMIAETPLLDSKKVNVSSGTETKTRKRNKPADEDAVPISVAASLTDAVSAPAVAPSLSMMVSAAATSLSMKADAVEGRNQISLMVRDQADLMPNVISSHYSAPVPVPCPSFFVPKSTTSHLLYPVSSVPTDHGRRSELGADKRPVHVEDFNKVEEAKVQADVAATHAAAAVSQCEGLWGQLSRQANSGLTSDAECRLAFAAVAVSAAASVSKAAAAAAKIASSAAVQAKQIAEEAVTKSGTLNVTEHDAILASNFRNFTSAFPVSILKGGNQNDAYNLSVSAAREAARKRVEATSAAARHAKNLDAILKAAELAAEAVTHAGKIVAMSEFNLSELAVAGPNNYWKVLQVANRPGSKLDNANRNTSMTNNVGAVPNYMNQKRPDANMHATNAVVSPIQKPLSKNLLDDRGEYSSKPHKDENASDMAKTSCAAVYMDVELRSNSLTLTSIKEGSCVEVLKKRGDSKKAWFTGTVLSLKNAEALVCYNELKSNDGPEQLQEWISIEAKDGDAPKIRIPHPMTTLQFDTTKKRCRAAVKDHSWSVGDKVDVWVRDCWCEGIITAKNEDDATSLSVGFPAHEERLIVKVWHVRPALIWSDGQWTEWGRSQQSDICQRDTPAEKRPKLGSISIETKGNRSARNLAFGEISGNEESRLPLSANEKVFSLGSLRVESKPTTVRSVRSGMEKEGSKVVFGVPKSGKKRKFLKIEDMAKHNADDVPRAKLQGLGYQGIRNSSKFDLKEKKTAESKPRDPMSGKPPSVPRRIVAKKVASASSQPGTHDVTSSDHAVKGPISSDKNESDEHNLTESGSPLNIEETTGGSSVVFPSQSFLEESRKRKLRKFEDMTKHYADEVRRTKQQGLGYKGIRNNSKFDLKEKQTAQSKPRDTMSGKPPSVPRRTVAKKVDSDSSQPGTSSDNTVKDSISNDENESGEHNLTESGSSLNVEETTGGSMVFSSQSFLQESHQKMALRNIKSEAGNQGKLAPPASGKPAKIEGDEKLVSEISEPRRSNRRILPTSRLLEGLQTSPIIPKVPSLDKAHRIQNKGTARGKQDGESSSK